MALLSSSYASEFCLRTPPPSVHLKKILANYPEGTQIFKEALQNADDASATQFAIILDDRRQATSVHADLDRFLGPALLFYNNGVFTADDWLSIQNMFESNKASSFSAIGRFGMGSRSYFHVTDLLAIISNSNYAFIDPDHLLSASGGEKLDFVTARNLFSPSKFKLLQHHLKPFENIFEFSSDRPFPGTIFRLPLRLGKYARTSNFAPYEYTPSKIQAILDLFSREVQDCLIFLQNVNDVQFHKWPEEEDLPRILSRIQVSSATDDFIKPVFIKDLAAFKFLPRHRSTVAEFLREITYSPEDLRSKLNSYTAITDTGILRFEQTDFDCNHQVVVDYWLVSAKICINDEIMEMVESTQAIPLIGIAAPLKMFPRPSFGFSDDYCCPIDIDGEYLWPMFAEVGRLFTFLPISDFRTHFPVHVNGTFCLTDNRRDIWLNIKDTEGRARIWGRWNRILLFHFLPEVYASILSILGDENTVYGCWPSPKLTESSLSDFFTEFKTQVAKLPVLFLADGSRVSPESARFVKLSQTTQTAMREALMVLKTHDVLELFRTLTRIGQKSNQLLVAVPNRVLECAVEPSQNTISFLALMYTVILPTWNNMPPPALTKTKYFLHWILSKWLTKVIICLTVLCKTLSQGRLDEVGRFKPLCENLRCVPVRRQSSKWTPPGEFLENDRKTSNDEVEDYVCSVPTVHELENEEGVHKYILVNPAGCYDVGLKGFKVAGRAIPCGEFSSPAVLKVFRSWGMKQTLTWSDMTQELVFRLCTESK